MLFSPILDSKIQVPPTNYDYIHRQNLFGLLESGLGKKLILVSAGPGFGKTSLVSSWVKSKELPIFWITLNQSDQDFSYFFSYLFKSFQPYYPEFESRYKNIFKNITPSVNVIMGDFINIISDTQEKFLVIDDYHYIKSEKIHEAIKFLIKHAPINLHIIIISRSNPPLNLSILRINESLLEIKSDNLRLSLDETKELLEKSLDKSLTSEEINQISVFTDGWITGVKLLTLNLQKGSFPSNFIQNISGKSKYIEEYLLEEVYLQLPFEIQDFLITSSILEQFCSSLCNSICNIDNSQSIIDYLENENLFIIPFEKDGNWYKYNPQFRDFLLNKLEVNNQKDKSNLHKSACDWFLNQSYFNLAISHAKLGKLESLVVYIVNNISSDLLENGQENLLIKFLDGINFKEVIKYPDLSLIYIRVLFENNQISKVDEYFEIIYQDHTFFNSQKESEDLFLCHLLILKGIINVPKNNFTLIEKIVSEVKEKLPDNDWRWQAYLFFLMGWIYEHQNVSNLMEEAYRAASILSQHHDIGGLLSIASLTFLTNHLFAEGKLEKTQQTCQEAINIPTIDNQFTNLLGINNLLLGAVYFHRNKLDEAEFQFKKGLSLLRYDFDVLWKIDALYFLCLIQIMKNNQQNSSLYFQEIIYLFSNATCPKMIKNHVNGLLIRLNIELNNFQEPYEWSLIFNPDNRINNGYQFFDFNVPFLYTLNFDRFSLIRYLVKNKKFRKSKIFLDQWLSEFIDQERTVETIEFFILNAIVNYQLNNIDEAKTSFIQVITKAFPEKFSQLLTKDLSTLEKILNLFDPDELLNSLANNDAKRKELILFLEEIFTDINFIKNKINGKRENLLSPREYEILQLISQGLSNEEITEKLCITKNTLRSHIKNLNQKLFAQNRTHAVFLAKKQGLIK